MCGLVLLRFLEPEVTAARVVEGMAATVIFFVSSYKLFVKLFYNKCKRYNK